MSTQHDKAFEVVSQVLAESLGVETSDISLADHLEDDLLLEVELALPEVISKVSSRLELDLAPEVITEFKKEVEKDPQKASVAELVALIKEEMDFNKI